MKRKGTLCTSFPQLIRQALVNIMWDHLPDAALAHIAACLGTTSDRHSARRVCRSCKAALDAHWSRACFLARLSPQPAEAAGGPAAHPPVADAALLTCFRSLAPLWPQLRELDIVELSTSRVAALLPQLTPGSFPQLTRLALSSPLREPCTDGGQVARLQLQQLRELRLDDVVVEGGLRSIAQRLPHLGALHVGSTLHANAGGPAWQDVECLTALTQLQALTLPALGEEARQALPQLTTLTSLAFEAAGSGAVGGSLAALPRLQRLRIELHHRREHFLVLHPAVEWQALAQLQALTSLEVLNWAAGRHNAAPLLSAPMYIWADQGAAEEHAGVLLGGLPALRCLRVTAAYCRLERRHGTEAGAVGVHEGGSDGAAGGVHSDGGEDGCSRVVCDGRGRWWHLREQRVPVGRPGSRRGEEWYGAWWQRDVQHSLEEMYGQDEPSVLRYRADTLNIQGWTAIRQDQPATFDLELTYSPA